MVDAHALFAEIETLLVQLEHNAAPAADLHEYQRREANGTGADDQHAVTGLRVPAMNGVTPDGQRFHQRQLVPTQTCRGMQLPRGHNKIRSHSAVGVHTQDLQVLAAIAVALAASKAVLAIDVWLD